MLSIASGVDDEPLQMFHTQDALFAENAGQWDTDEVYFGYNKGGTQIYFTDNGLEFGLSRTVNEAADPLLAESLATDLEPFDTEPEIESTHFSLSFDNATPTVPVGADQAVTKFNYHLGEQENWVDGVSTYKTVLYDDLYAGIDLHTFSQHGQMKYEFHVSPGSDYTQIELSYTGIEGLSIGTDGSLYIATELGEIVDEDLYIYQTIDGEEVEVTGRFTLLDADTYTFTVTGDYDPTAELVIDPNIDWGSYLGGTGYDATGQIATDAQGNVYVCGSTQSSEWGISGGWDTTYGGNSDGYVVKLTNNGAHLWSTYLGGLSNDYATGVITDVQGDIFVTGFTNSSGWGISGGWDATYGGGRDGYIVKLNDDGLHVWSTYLGGSGIEGAYVAATDIQGNIYVCGDTASSDWNISGGWDTTYGGNFDGYVIKLSSGGSHLWSTYLGGSSSDCTYHVATDAQNNVYASGFWNDDGYVVKFSSTGSHLWGTYLDGGFATEVITDAQDNVYVCGSFDGNVAKLSSAGTHIWSVSLDGVGEGISTDAQGNVYVCGRTDTSHGYVTKLSGSGSILWEDTNLTGLAWGVTTDDQGNVYVCGNTASSGWGISGGWDTTYGGNGDGFVLKINDETFTPVAAITATKTGKMVSSWDPNHDEFIYSKEYDEGIQLGACVGVWPSDNQQESKPTYSFALPNPVIGSETYLTRIDIAVTGKSNEDAGVGSGVTVSVGPGGYGYELPGDNYTQTTSCYFTGGAGSDWSNVLRNDGQAWYLDVTLAAIEDDDWYDLQDVTVTYTYQGLSGDELARMDQIVRGIAQLNTFHKYHTSYLGVEQPANIVLKTAYNAYCAEAANAIADAYVDGVLNDIFGESWAILASIGYGGYIEPHLDIIWGLGWPDLTDNLSTAAATGDWYFGEIIQGNSWTHIKTLANRTNSTIGYLELLADTYYAAFQDGAVSAEEMPGINTAISNVNSWLDDLQIDANYVASDLVSSYAGTPAAYEAAVEKAIDGYMAILHPLYAYDYTVGGSCSPDIAESYFCEYQELLDLQAYAAPDLTVNDLATSGVTSVSAMAGDSITIDFDVQNQGTASAAASIAKIVWSTDSTIDLNDQQLDLESQVSLAAGTESGESVTITIPSSAVLGQTYYLGVIADYDNQVDEFNEANNAGTGRIAVTIVDTEVPNLLPLGVNVGTGDAVGQLRYEDNVAISTATIGTGDILVTGPNGYSQTATLVSVDDNTDGTPRTATYRVTSPGAEWTKDDNGTYQITMVANQVSDTAGNFVAAGSIGTFEVAIPNQLPTADAGGPYEGDEGSSIALSVADSVDTDGTIVLYEWDLDNDGQYDDATGVTTSYNASTVGTFTVAVKVTDDNGASDTASAEVTVLAANPTPGDANRDGRVDGSDVTILAGNWQHGVIGEPNATWSMGDFNADGKVDGSDVTILAGNWQAGVTSAVIAVSDPEPEQTSHFTPPESASLAVATVPRRESLSPRRFIAPTPQSTDTVLAESTWSETDYTAVAKDLTPVSVKKSTAASDELFALGLDPYGDPE